MVNPWFDEIEAILVELSYHAKDNDINLIKNFIRAKLRALSVIKFNEFLTEHKQDPIDNHWDFITNNLDKIYFDFLASNANDCFIDMLIQNPKHIEWYNLSSKTNDRAMDLLIQNPNKIYWAELSQNSNDRALDLLEASPDKINHYYLLRNSNDRSYSMLKKYITDPYNCEFLPHNSCNYDKSKIAAFNNMKLFKQLPYFKL